STATLPGSSPISQAFCRWPMARCSSRLRPKVMSKGPSCSAARASTTSCGARAAGPAPTTRWPTPWATRPSAPSSGWVKSWPKTPKWATDKWYIAYHRHPLGDKDGNHRVVCLEEMHFDTKGLIEPVILTTKGVAAQPLKR
nr:hypothetical protein [Tanacetum cinerariifolium]